MIQIHWIPALYIVINIILTTWVIASDEMIYVETNGRKLVICLLYSLFGTIIMIHAILLQTVWDMLISPYLWNSIKFYYRLWFTNYFEDIFENDNYSELYPDKESKLLLWNQFAEAQKGRIKRAIELHHAAVLNDKFHYNYVKPNKDDKSTN